MGQHITRQMCVTLSVRPNTYECFIYDSDITRLQCFHEKGITHWHRDLKPEVGRRLGSNFPVNSAN